MKKAEQKQVSLGYMRLNEVLDLLPISKSTWFRYVKSGKCPKPLKFGNTALYKREEIEHLLLTIGEGSH